MYSNAKNRNKNKQALHNRQGGCREQISIRRSEPTSGSSRYHVYILRYVQPRPENFDEFFCQ